MTLDESLFWWVHGKSGKSRWVDLLFQGFSAQETWIIAALLVVAYVVVIRSSKGLFWILVLSAALGLTDLLTYQVLKMGFGILRPCYVLEGVRLMQDSCGSLFGFPSNHAANAGAAFGIGIHVTQVLWKRLGLFCLAATVCVSRVYLGVHFPSDVFWGFVFGFAVSMMGSPFFQPWWTSWSQWWRRQNLYFK